MLEVTPRSKGRNLAVGIGLCFALAVVIALAQMF